MVSLFNQRYNPKVRRSKSVEETLLSEVKKHLDNVSNLDDDRIIRRYLDLILATTRTNFYQSDAQGNEVLCLI
ncbi:NAD-glutamate dehydrogenase [Paraglaciecola sp. Hal342]